MSRVRKSLLEERNLTRIFLLKLKTDRNGEYISYCYYHRHKGIIGNSKARECEERICIHYRVFREER